MGYISARARDLALPVGGGKSYVGGGGYVCSIIINYFGDTGVKLWEGLLRTRLSSVYAFIKSEDAVYWTAV